MLRKLTEQGLVTHAPYKGAQLTVEGERAALEVLRHHRLLELFLHRALGMPLNEVHAISERLETYIAAWLSHPTHDPHGDPAQLRALMTLGIEPGAEVQLAQADTALGTLELEVREIGGTTFGPAAALALTVAAQVMVQGEEAL